MIVKTYDNTHHDQKKHDKSNGKNKNKNKNTCQKKKNKNEASPGIRNRLVAALRALAAELPRDLAQERVAHGTRGQPKSSKQL